MWVLGICVKYKCAVSHDLFIDVTVYDCYQQTNKTQLVVVTLFYSKSVIMRKIQELTFNSIYNSNKISDN